MSKNSNYRCFKIDLPEEWSDQSVYTFMGPDDSGVQHLLSLGIDPETEHDTLEEFARERIQLATGEMPDIEVLKDESKTLPSGKTVYEYVYKTVPTDDKVIFQKMIFLLQNGVGYTFVAPFSKKTIKTIGLEVDKIIDSFVPHE